MVRPYKMWSLSTAPIPPRHALYELAPRHPGTGQVEGLLSYLLRLAEAHGVTAVTVIKSMTQLPLVSTPFTTNGAGELLDCLLVGLASQVHSTALTGMTLQVWRHVLSTTHLFRTSHAWCPGCFEEQAKQGRVLYLPLLWSLRDVTACPRHGSRLCIACPACGAMQAVHKNAHRVGYCGTCRSSLRPAPTAPPKAGGSVWDRWVARSVQRLIEMTQWRTQPPEPACFARSLRHCLTFIGATQSQLADHIHVNERHVNCWMRQVAKPTLSHLLRLGFCLGVPMADLLSGDAYLHAVRLQALPDEAVMAIRASADCQARLRQELETIQQDDTNTLSMYEISLRLERTMTYLERHFPDQYRSLVERRKRIHDRSRPACMRPRYSDILKAVRSLQRLGAYPAQERVAEAVKMRSDNPNFLDMWREALQDCGYIPALTGRAAFIANSAV